MSPTPVSACGPPTEASAPPTCGGTPAAASDAGSSRVSDVANTVPVIASPTVPPTCWKNDRLLDRGADLADRHAVLDDEREAPRTSAHADSRHQHRQPQERQGRVGAELGQHRADPRPSTTSAPNVSQRYRPVRATICPEATALKISPPSSGSIW